MPLSDRAIRSARPGSKPYQRSDERGLYLLVQPNGARYWRFKYRYGGKERLLALGVYPDVSLKAAREKRDEARRLVAAGVDPNAQRAAQPTLGRPTYSLFLASPGVSCGESFHLKNPPGESP